MIIHRIKNSCVANDLSNLINKCSENDKLFKSEFQLVSLEKNGGLDSHQYADTTLTAA